MDPAATKALERLRNPDGDMLDRLARLMVTQTTATPLRDIASARWIAGQIATALEAATRDDALVRFAQERIAAEKARWGTEERLLREFVSAEVTEPLLTMLAKPYIPDEELVFRLIDQPPIRNLVADVLEDTVRRFAARARNVDTGALGGVASRAAKSGRAFGKGFLGGRASSLAANIKATVSEEFEGLLDKGVKEFVAGATTRTLKHLVTTIASDEESDQMAELRVALLDTLLDTAVKDLVAEVDKMQPEDAVSLLQEAVRSAIGAPDFVDRTTERVQTLLDEAGGATLGEWLTEVELLDVWTDTTSELVADRLRATVQLDAFEAWWAELFD